MPANVGGSILQQLSQLMETEGLDEKDALKRVARERGVSKSDVYRELQRERSKR
jgi:16S rRNA (cytidine1402-2'-O)-methyltransferase